MAAYEKVQGQEDVGRGGGGGKSWEGGESGERWMAWQELQGKFSPTGSWIMADHLDSVKACFQIFLRQSILDLSLVPGHNSWPSVTVFIPKAMPFWVSFRSPNCLASLRWQDLNPKVPFPELGRCWMKSSGFSSPGSCFCLGHHGHMQVRDQASL